MLLSVSPGHPGRGTAVLSGQQCVGASQCVASVGQGRSCVPGAKAEGITWGQSPALVAEAAGRVGSSKGGTIHHCTPEARGGKVLWRAGLCLSVMGLMTASDFQ